MIWKTCSTHIALGVFSYVCFLVAAIGGATFLFVSRMASLKEVSKFRRTVQQVRSQLDLIYLSIGLILLTTAIILGTIQREKTTGLWWSGDPKQIVSIFTYWFYLVSVVIAWILRFKKDKQTNKFIAWISLWGLIPLIINGVVVNYLLPSFHHFL